MRAVVQRVKKSSVKVNEEIVGQIENGLMVLLGVSENDSSEDVDYLVEKIVNLRIFKDSEDKMNLSLVDLNYDLLVVSQFTLYGDCRKGKRPNFMEAAKPEKAQNLYNEFVQKCRQKGVRTETGIFQASMEVSIVNDGPVTVIVESRQKV